jgi:hypothetical protein
VALPVLTHYFYGPNPGGDTWAESNTASWFPPTGVTSSTPPAGLVFYALLFGPVTGPVSVTPTATLVATGSVGESNFYLYRRETGPSEPISYRFEYPPAAGPGIVILGIGVAGSAWDVAGTPQFAIGNTATSGSLAVPPEGETLSVHIWGGMDEPPHHTSLTWEPDPTNFPDNRRFGYGHLFAPYVGKIGEIRNVVTAPGKAATLADWPGLDNFGIQFLFSDVPVEVGGWGVGMIRMGPN